MKVLDWVGYDIHCVAASSEHNDILQLRHAILFTRLMILMLPPPSLSMLLPLHISAE